MGKVDPKRWPRHVILQGIGCRVFGLEGYAAPHLHQNPGSRNRPLLSNVLELITCWLRMHCELHTSRGLISEQSLGHELHSAPKGNRL